jgi:hypothetical protein
MNQSSLFFIRQMPRCPQKTKTSLVHVGLAIFLIIISIGRLKREYLTHVQEQYKQLKLNQPCDERSCVTKRSAPLHLSKFTPDQRP